MEELRWFVLGEVESVAGPSPKGREENYAELKHNDMLYSQIPTLWELLTGEEKKWVVKNCESLGVVRNSNKYLNKFISFTIRRVKRPLDGSSDAILKQKLMSNWFDVKQNLFAYNPQTRETLRFDRFLGIQEDQNVYLMTQGEKQWVVKWEGYVQTNAESDEYAKLRSMGAQVPETLGGFKFLDFGVLVMEFLQPLDVTDRPSEVGKQLLQQLAIIHTYACYFDLKTDNIRKRNSSPPKYFIIDMNLSKDIKPGGTIHRNHFSPFYTSQLFPRRYPHLVSSYLNDLIELKYILHQMIAKRMYEAKVGLFQNATFEPTNGFYLQAGDFFADPDRMIKDEIGNTQRGFLAIRTLLEYPADYQVTHKYMYLLDSLQHGVPPANIHQLLAAQLGGKEENDLFKDTEPNIKIACQTCSMIGAQYKCGKCYHKVSFLCSNGCAKEHVCE